MIAWLDEVEENDMLSKFCVRSLSAVVSMRSKHVGVQTGGSERVTIRFNDSRRWLSIQS